MKNLFVNKTMTFVASIVLGSAMVLGAATPANASSLPHSAIVKYKQGAPAYLYSCHSITGDPWVCETNPVGNKRNLPKGQDTYHYFGWEDCDAIYVPDGYDVYTVGPLNGHHWTDSGWHKIRGNGRLTVNVTIVPNGG